MKLSDDIVTLAVELNQVEKATKLCRDGDREMNDDLLGLTENYSISSASSSRASSDGDSSPGAASIQKPDVFEFVDESSCGEVELEGSKDEEHYKESGVGSKRKGTFRLKSKPPKCAKVIDSLRWF